MRNSLRRFFISDPVAKKVYILATDAATTTATAAATTAATTASFKLCTKPLLKIQIGSGALYGEKLLVTNLNSI